MSKDEEEPSTPTEERDSDRGADHSANRTPSGNRETEPQENARIGPKSDKPATDWSKPGADRNKTAGEPRGSEPSKSPDAMRGSPGKDFENRPSSDPKGNRQESETTPMKSESPPGSKNSGHPSPGADTESK